MDPTVEVRTRFEIYCDILYRGILEIRASTRDYEYISEQADHLHNLPGLLREMNNEDLHQRIQAASATGGGWFEELKISIGVCQSRRFLGRLLRRSSTR